MAYTFGANDILAALGVTAADFEVQESGSDTVNDSAVVRDKSGAYVAASEQTFNFREEKTITIKAKTAAAGTAVSFKLGGVGTSDVVVTQFNLKQAYNDHATLTVTAHKHTNGESGAAHIAVAALAAGEVAVAGLSLGFGAIQDFFEATANKNLQSVDLSGSVEHVDKLSNTGKFLVGASHGFKLECTQEYVDDGAAVTVASPWVQDSQGVKSSNSDLYTRSIKAHCYDVDVLDVEA